MAKAWIEDRSGHRDYQAARAAWREAKKQGSRRNPPGQWRVRWYDPGNKPRAKTFVKHPQAEDYQAEITDQLRKGTYRDPSLGRTTFGAVAEDWYGSLHRQGRTTLATYRGALDAYVLPKWGSRTMESITWKAVSEWIGELVGTPGAAGRTLSSARVTKIFRVFAAVSKRAVKAGLIAADPALEHDLPRPPTSEEHVYLTCAQLEALAEAAGDYRPLVLLLGYTGLRWGEVVAVTAGRVDVEARRVRIVHAYSTVGGHMEIGPVKNHEKRSVPLPRSVAEELRPRLAARQPEDLLFPAPQRGPLRYRNFRSRVWDPAVKAAGLGGLGVTPHKLRHTAASLAIASGADVKVVQTMLGHKSATMTLDLYGHLFADRLDEVADRLDDQRQRMLAQRHVYEVRSGKAEALPEA